MRIYYTASKYGSHLRVANAYREIIQTMHPLVDELGAADVIVLHHEPRDFTALYRDYPALAKKYVIGYCVWESDELPEAYKRSISHLQEVWTPSQYSGRAFERYHRNVHRIPHVIERNTGFSPADLALVRRGINYDPACRYFLVIALQARPRKNIATLVRAFRAVHSRMPNTKLLVKVGDAGDVSWGSGAGVINLPGRMNRSQINALYSLASAYVSAHHAEGWGLTLSDAMLFEKPVIATGYSGNLEFMDEDNSFLLGYTEAPIRPEDCGDLFHTGMRWAYPHEEDLQNKLLLLEQHRDGEWVSAKIRKASADVLSFSRASVRELIRRRLDDIAHSCL